MMLGHALRFGLVGGAATLVHLCCGLTLIQVGLLPFWANALAFLIAFTVSLLGHFGFSFSDQHIDFLTSFKRFALIAICGFAMNEALLVTLLTQTPLVPAIALVLTTGTAAVFTFYLSRNWAFRTQVDHRNSRLGGM